LGSVLLAGLLTGCAHGESQPATAEPASEQQVLAEVKRHVKSDFVRPMSDAELAQPTAQALAAALDPPGRFFTAAEMASLRSEAPALFNSIEVTVESSEGRMILTPSIGGVADLAGLLISDVLVAVDDQPLAGLSQQQAVDLLRGLPGSKVRLSIVRGAGAPLQIELARRSSASNNLRIARPDSETLVLGVARFEDTTLLDATAALAREWKSRPFKGLVLDLRRCPGGLLTTTIGLAAMFLPSGSVVGRTAGRAAGANQTFTTEPATYTPRRQSDPIAGLPEPVRQLPLVLLIDEGTKSGAEFIAAALQDAKRATIVGRKTLGLGLVQTFYPIPGGHALRLPTAYWQSPSGVAINGRGVQPEHVISKPESSTEMAAALEHLRRLVAAAR
jgi:carboxyl-terminal processing protease